MRGLLSSIRLLVACALALILVGGAAFSSTAAPLRPIEPSASTGQDDDDDDADGGTAAGALDAPADRPAHIHAGTCAELDPNPAFPLENAMPFSGEDDEVEHSVTTVEASLDDILAAPHAINVHLSPEQADIYVACGEITGTVAEGELVVALHQQNGSGLAGIAMLTEDGTGTEVHFYLAPCDPESGTGVAPVGDDDAGDDTPTVPAADDADADATTETEGDDAADDGAGDGTDDGTDDSAEGEDEED